MDYFNANEISNEMRQIIKDYNKLHFICPYCKATNKFQITGRCYSFTYDMKFMDSSKIYCGCGWNGKINDLEGM